MPDGYCSSQFQEFGSGGASFAISRGLGGDPTAAPSVPRIPIYRYCMTSSFVLVMAGAWVSYIVLMFAEIIISNYYYPFVRMAADPTVS
jgi:hypothetical protein